MAEIVNLNDFRDRALEKKAFGSWRNRFKETFGRDIRLSDLSPRTLYVLAVPGEAGTAAFYDLIMGVLDKGGADDFPQLGQRDQMRVMDIHLFLADQVRFEMMRRLGWIGLYPLGECAVLEMVRSFEKTFQFSAANPPKLASSHSEYEAYLKLHPRDQESLIRRMLPGALEIFRKRIGG